MVPADFIFRQGMSREDIQRLPAPENSAANELRNGVLVKIGDKNIVISGINMISDILGILVPDLKKMPVPVVANHAAILRWYRDGSRPYAIFMAHDDAEGHAVDTTIIFRGDIDKKWPKIIAEYRAKEEKNRELKKSNTGGIADANFHGPDYTKYTKEKILMKKERDDQEEDKRENRQTLRPIAKELGSLALKIGTRK